MNVKINSGGNIEIDTDDLLRYITETQCAAAAQSLSTRDDVIRYVMEQVFEGYTTDGYRGSESSYSEIPYTPLGIFRRRIAEDSSNIAADEIDGLKSKIKQLEMELSIRQYPIDENFPF